MRKNFIKVLFMTVSALLCSQIWAQGSDGVSAEGSTVETAKRYEKTYTITVKYENNDNSIFTETVGLSTINGKTEITSGFNPTNGYSAFFIADDGRYFGFVYDSQTPDLANEARGKWIEYEDVEQKTYFRTILNYVKGKNCKLTTSDGESYLEDVGYTNLYTADLGKLNGKSFICSGNDGFNQLYIYNESPGIFVYAQKIISSNGNPDVKVICFRDKNSIAEITDNLDIENFKSWLEKDNDQKKIDSNYEIYKRLAKLIYESLKNSDGYLKGLYRNNENSLINEYLMLAMLHNKNVYFSELEKMDKNFISEKYKAFIDSKDNPIVKAAETYLKLGTKKKDNMPYALGFSDIPEIYNIKKDIEKNEINLGCDDIGFLNGIIYLSNSKVKPYKSGLLKSNYDNYKNDVNDYKKNKRKYKQENKIFPNIENTISIEDLNKISIVVGNITKVAAGDIVVFDDLIEKSDGNTINSNKKVAVIVDPVNDKATSTIKSPDELTVIWMNKEIGAEKKKLSEIWTTNYNGNVPEYLEIRRILTEDKISKEETNWNVLNDDVTDESVEICWMREDTQTSGERFHFIPNTGEYLNLEKIRITAYNHVGIRVRGKTWKVTLNGAKDRNWISGNTDGNVNNNSECKFEILVGNKKGILSKDSESDSYSITWEDEEPVFTIDSSDNILFYNSAPAQIKIRPENASATRPGDDLILEFKLEKEQKSSSGNNSNYIVLTVPEKNYIVVYDKKMVWRANLYINSKDAMLGGLDWNDAHPWNVPASGNNGPEWWDADIWGNNQWNKSYNLQVNSEVTNLTTLPDGNGGQVVQFSQWTPVRNKSNNYSKNIYTDRVSYDYPHQNIGNNKHINAWDSPFDFIWKLNEQKKAIVMNFSNEVQTINSNNSITSDLQTSLLKSGGKFPRGLTNNTSASNYAFISNESVETLASWDVTSAPENRWRYYWKEHITSNNTTQNAYVVGLGFIEESPVYSFNDVKLNEPNTDINFIDYRSAGTDCIGFVQRTASYQNLPGNTDSGRIYKWPQIDNGKIEENLDLDTQSRWNTWGYKTLQPARHRDSNYTKPYINISDFYNDANDGYEYEYMVAKKGTPIGPTEESFNEIKEKILKIIPGDIIQYTGSHIGTIETIDYSVIENSNTIIDLLKAINVIESCYSYRVNSLIIRNIYMGGEMLDNDNIAGNKSAAPRCSWLIDSEGNFRNFTIERLLSK